jgi:hypothetical protein
MCFGGVQQPNICVLILALYGVVKLKGKTGRRQMRTVRGSSGGGGGGITCVS